MPEKLKYKDPITVHTTLGQLETMVHATKHPATNDPAVFPTHLASLAFGLSHVGEACNRRFRDSNDRPEVERKIGQAILLLTQVAQSAGTNLPRCIEAFRQWKRAQKLAADHVQNAHHEA